MSIDFDRNRVQVSFEAFVGAASPEELISRKDGFKSHALSQQEVQQLSNDISQDAIDFFYNGILSFAEGIDSIFLKRFSWATVKLYYSIYYHIRYYTVYSYEKRSINIFSFNQFRTWSLL